MDPMELYEKNGSVLTFDDDKKMVFGSRIMYPVKINGVFECFIHPYPDQNCFGDDRVPYTVYTKTETEKFLKKQGNYEMKPSTPLFKFNVVKYSISTLGRFSGSKLIACAALGVDMKNMENYDVYPKSGAVMTVENLVLGAKGSSISDSLRKRYLKTEDNMEKLKKIKETQDHSKSILEYKVKFAEDPKNNVVWYPMVDPDTGIEFGPDHIVSSNLLFKIKDKITIGLHTDGDHTRKFTLGPERKMFYTSRIAYASLHKVKIDGQKVSFNGKDYDSINIHDLLLKN